MSGLNVDIERLNEQILDEQAEEDPGSADDRYWLDLATQTYRDSTDYWDSSLRREWEHSIALFQNRHPPGSKYNTDAYKARSRLMRPKTRAAIRQHEAAAAAAFFSTADLVSVEPGNDNDPIQRAAADVNKELMEYRLARSIPWFLTCMGAYQSAMVSGAVASKQYWEYRELEVEYEAGGETVKDFIVADDKPVIDLVPLENLRFDPGAKWTDPINSSPYVIALIPMVADDVMTRMAQKEDKAGRPKWREASLSDILTHGRLHNYGGTTDSTSQARDGQSRQDRYDVTEGSMFSTVWVREYIMRIGGRDWVFWTLGDTFLLSEPVPIERVYLQGRRPYRLGICMLEAHKAIPQSLAYLSRDLAAAANEIQNSRMDNVRLVLNKRYYRRRGASIDTTKLSRSVPGGVVDMDSFDDIKSEEFNDVTGSSYAEQDRLNLDFDELMGSFAQSSVQSNRALNETVGGMQMIKGGSDSVTEYQLKTFAETWVEPVLTDLMYLEQAYETDETILALAGEKADVYKRLGVDEVYDELLINDVICRVNVGMGATDPVDRVNKFNIGMQSITALPGMLARIDGDEVASEVFGRLGYRDGQRFLKSEEEMGEPPPNPEMIELQMKDEHFKAQLAQDRELGLMDLAMKYKTTMRKMESDLGVRKYQADTAAQSTTLGTILRERGRMASEASRRQEMELKRDMGSGI